MPATISLLLTGIWVKTFHAPVCGTNASIDAAVVSSESWPPQASRWPCHDRHDNPSRRECMGAWCCQTSSAEAFPHIPCIPHSRHRRHRESHPEHTLQKRTGAEACEACVPMIHFPGWAAQRSAVQWAHRELLHKCRRGLHRRRPKLHFCRISWRNPVTTLRAERQSFRCYVSPLLQIRPDSHQREAAVLAKLLATETEKDPTSLSSQLKHSAAFGLLVSQRTSEAAQARQWARSATQGLTWQGSKSVKIVPKRADPSAHGGLVRGRHRDQKTHHASRVSRGNHMSQRPNHCSISHVELMAAFLVQQIQ